MAKWDMRNYWLWLYSPTGFCLYAQINMRSYFSYTLLSWSKKSFAKWNLFKCFSKKYFTILFSPFVSFFVIVFCLFVLLFVFPFYYFIIISLSALAGSSRDVKTDWLGFAVVPGLCRCNSEQYIWMGEMKTKRWATLYKKKKKITDPWRKENKKRLLKSGAWNKRLCKRQKKKETKKLLLRIIH